MKKSISRRSFLKAVGALSAAGALAACGGSSASTAASTASSAAPAASSEASGSAAADALGISRQHFYAVLSAFRRRVLAASAHILSREESARAALPHIGTRTAE